MDSVIAPCVVAKTRAGTPYKSPAMKDGRCRLHGGRSTEASMSIRMPLNMSIAPQRQ